MDSKVLNPEQPLLILHKASVIIRNIRFVLNAVHCPEFRTIMIDDYTEMRYDPFRTDMDRQTIWFYFGYTSKANDPTGGRLEEPTVIEALEADSLSN